MPAPPTTLHDQTPISDNFGVSSGVHYSHLLPPYDDATEGMAQTSSEFLKSGGA